MTHTGSSQPATLTIGPETQTPRGWSYEVTISRGGHASGHEVRLSWADHDHWCGGAKPPSELVRFVLEWLLAREPDRELPAAFDAALIRRWRPEIDEEVAL